MRLFFVIPVMDAGGAENVVVSLCHGLVEQGHEVALAGAPGMRDAELAGLPIDRHLLPDRGRSVPGSLETARELRRLIAESRPDLVHANNVRATVEAGLALGLRRRPPLVASLQGIADSEYRQAAWIFRRARKVVCASNEVERRLHSAGYPLERTVVIPNAVASAPGLDERRRHEIDEEFDLGDGPIVACVGRLVEQKDHGLFLDVAARVRAAAPEVRFLLVGDGPLRDELRKHAADLKLNGAVRFTGPRPDARDLIARSDVLVFTSHWEGLSLAALEGLAAGVPVLSTAAHGMEELLGDGAGEVVSGRDPSHLAERLLMLLGDERRRAAMGTRGRDLAAKEYSVQRMVERYERVYDSVRPKGSD